MQGAQELHKLHIMVDSVAWNVETDALSAVADRVAKIRASGPTADEMAAYLRAGFAAQKDEWQREQEQLLLEVPDPPILPEDDAPGGDGGAIDQSAPSSIQVRTWATSPGGIPVLVRQIQGDMQRAQVLLLQNMEQKS